MIVGSLAKITKETAPVWKLRVSVGRGSICSRVDILLHQAQAALGIGRFTMAINAHRSP